MRAPGVRWYAAAAAVALVTAGCSVVAVQAGTSLAVGVAVTLTLPRNEVGAGALDPPPGDGPQVWLVVGDDRREGVHVPRAGDAAGRRADTLLLLAMTSDPPAVQLVAVPRDLRVDLAPHGRQRLGGLLDYGGQTLVRGVRSVTGAPVHHYVELDMGAVVAVVDAVGGVELEVPHRVRDSVTGLRLEAGTQRIDGEQTLAFARSRQYEEYRDGRWVRVGADDRGRLRRQLGLLAALHDELSTSMQPVRAWNLLRQVGRHASIDGATGAGDLATLVRALRADGWTATVLPTTRVVPVAESVSPFPPAHWGTTGTVVREEPAATTVLAPLQPEGADR